MSRHRQTCSDKQKLVFPGGGYGSKLTIFDALCHQGINVSKDIQFYPYRLAYDFECYFETPSNTYNSDNSETVLNNLVPASASICSNVPGYEKPVCFVSKGDPYDVVGSMYRYMQEVGLKSFSLVKDTFEAVFQALAHRINEHKDQNSERSDKIVAECTNLMQRLTNWIRRIPALGFNSGRFDINLVRQYLFPYLLESRIAVRHIIKRSNDYLSVVTDDVVFLDIKNYVAAGTSYEKWLKSNDVPQKKGVFPYDWFTSMECLNEKRLPPKEAFFSSLKQRGISQADYDNVEKLWRENNFQSMRDMLIWYNNLDVEPFLVAAQKMTDYWRLFGIDPFKGNAISLPGLALNYLEKHMTPHTILPLFPHYHSSLYASLRENIVGGLSFVVHRYHEKDVTILPNGEKVGWINSLDCNSLYLNSLGKETGTGVYALWVPESQSIESLPWGIGKKPTNYDHVIDHNMNLMFRRKFSYVYRKKEIEWLEWMSYTLQKRVEHKFNGRQKVFFQSKKIQYPVDGYIPEDKLVLQFHGCHWHGHGCKFDGNKKNESEKRKANTSVITQNLSSMGVTVIEQWECDWENKKRTNENLRKFIEEHFSLPIKRNRLCGRDIIANILNENLFGIIECDIEVPGWNEKLVQYFEEFPPICKNTEISIDDIGPFMQEYAVRNGYMKRPRRNLISSFWARKAFFTTPLVKWLLHNGLVITRIHQVVEMKPKKCFASIVDDVIAHRRHADRDPAYKSEGEYWKTLGNSLYGKTMTNKERHKDCKLVHDDFVDRLINSKRFSKMELVGATAYEVSMDKLKTVVDLPMTVAFFVYHYAKLRMLEFVYDFLKRYLRTGSYQIVCSDTDSIIAAYQDKCIDTLVKPELLDEYQQEGKPAFLATDEYSKRTPGLFKIELDATCIIALCSKTYLAYNAETDDKKVTSKGLSKTTNNFQVDDYRKVLETGVKGSGVNYGFKRKQGRFVKYKQRRDGLAYLYVKRQVLSDGVSTRALNL